MRSRLQILIAAVLLLFASCTNKQFYQGYLHKIDSLDASLEASASAYEQIDTSLIYSQYEMIREQLDSLKDSGAFEVHTAVNEYNYIGKTYKTFLRENALTINELKYSRDQLEHLRHDIGKRHLGEKEVVLYFNQEQKAVGILKERMDIFVRNINARMQKYKVLNPQIDSLINSQKKEGS